MHSGGMVDAKKDNGVDYTRLRTWIPIGLGKYDYTVQVRILSMHQRLLDSDSTVTDIGKSELHEYYVLKRSLGESTEQHRLQTCKLSYFLNYDNQITTVDNRNNR